MNEPITTDRRISYIDLHSRLVVYDRPMSCGMCQTCLGSRNGRCWNQGPYTADGIVIISGSATVQGTTTNG